MLRAFLLILIVFGHQGFAAEGGIRATNEDWESCFKLKDRTAADACYLRNAEAGHLGSQWLLGRKFEQGRDTDKDDAQAVYWYRKAAEQGHEFAQHYFGRKLFRGNGVPKDVNEGSRWMSKAAELGSGDAKWELANICDRADTFVLLTACVLPAFGRSEAVIDKEAEVAEPKILHWSSGASKGEMHLDDGSGNASGAEYGNPEIPVSVQVAANETQYPPYIEPFRGTSDRRILVDTTKDDEKLLENVVWVVNLNLIEGDSGTAHAGSGVLISQCHVLTANHVAFRHQIDEGLVLGKELRFKIPRDGVIRPEDVNYRGKVIGFDPEIRTIEPYIDKNLEQKYRPVFSSIRDWALVKLEKLKGGSYPGEKKKPFCIYQNESELLPYAALKTKSARAVGYPSDHTVGAPPRFHLVQDPNCRIMGKSGPTWYTTCHMKSGMSGGPIAFLERTSETQNACWRVLGINSKIKERDTNGFVAQDEQNILVGNQFAPIDKTNFLKIKQAMDANPCD